MTKSERLFEVLELIKKSPELTLKELARRCNVSERAIYRYVNTLSKVGVLVSFQKGGYKLQGYYGDIFKNFSTEGLESIKILLSSGMRLHTEEDILQYGRDFITLIDANLPRKVRQKPDEIEIVPEEVRAVSHGGTITIGQSTKPSIINPILTSETISVTLMNLIFSSLVKFDVAHRPIPDLAKSWEISEDGLVLTFFIREDVAFHDGHPLTAQDIEFTYSAIMDPKNMSPVAERYDPIDKVEAEGDYIFRIFLKYQFAPFMSRLGWAIAPRHLLENTDIRTTSFNKQPVGSGPFKLTDWSEDDTIILSANKSYFRKDRPILNRLIFKSYLDRKRALEAITQNEMDMALNLTASDLLFISENRTFRIYPASDFYYCALIFNLMDPTFKDARVRKALDHVIDKDSIVEDQLKGHGVICTGPFNPSSWAYNPDVKPAPYNIERARELLKNAGWEDKDGDGVLDKDGKPFEFSIGILNITDILERIALAISSQLAKVGIRVKILRSLNGSALSKRSFQAVLTMNTTGIDPDYTSRLWHSESGSTNLASYKNKFVDNLLELGRQVQGLESRKAAYHKIHEMIHDDCPAIFLASVYEYIGSNYQFRNARFSSTMHFLNTSKDWQIVKGEKEDAVSEPQERISISARATG